MARPRGSERPRAVRGAGAAREARAPRPAPALPAWAWPLTIPLALAVFAVALRGGHPGTPVLDDYSFLHFLTFQHPLDPFDSMGATYYWRPVSRQLYFSLVGPALFAAPWLAAVVHGALLAATAWLAYRLVRRELGAPVAACVAAGVVLAEPARVLVAWPSGAQHLLAGLFALLALHEARAGRLATATAAALAGVLSHESAALALPLVPLVVWRDRRGPRAVAAAAVAMAAVLAAWAAGYAVALRHGVLLPPAHAASGASTPLVAKLPAVYARALPAALDVEDLDDALRAFVVVVLAIAAVVAAVRLLGPAGAARRRAALPVVTAGAAWFTLGVLPLAVLLPDWNAWRAWTPTLGLLVAAPALLGAAAPWLAATWVGLRLAALLVAPSPPPIVTREVQPFGSHVSFVQLSRLQLVTASARATVLGKLAPLPAHAAVCYWQMPRLAEFAFQGSRALEVWTRDSTITWSPFGGQRGLTTPYAGGIEFLYDGPPWTAAIPGRVIAIYQQAAALAVADRVAESDSLLRVAIAGIDHDRGPLVGTLVVNLALNAYRLGDVVRADSLNEHGLAIGAETSSYWLLRALREERTGALDRARTSVARALDLERGNPAALALAQRLGVVR